MAKMNIRTVSASRVVLCLGLLLAAAPAHAGLDFTPPQLQYDDPAPPPVVGSHEPRSSENAGSAGLEIAPGISVAPDLDPSSPYTIVDPTNPRRPFEPLLRLQVPIPR
jgi:hypothetical protein